MYSNLLIAKHDYFNGVNQKEKKRRYSDSKNIYESQFVRKYGSWRRIWNALYKPNQNFPLVIKPAQCRLLQMSKAMDCLSDKVYLINYNSYQSWTLNTLLKIIRYEPVLIVRFKIVIQSHSRQLLSLAQVKLFSVLTRLFVILFALKSFGSELKWFFS